MIREKILNKIRSYVVSNYIKLEFSDMCLGELTFNHKCHLNSIQKIKENRAESVIACVAVSKYDKYDIFIHFINKSENGIYQDNTLGYLYNEYDYYIVKELSKEEEQNIGNYFKLLRDFLIKNNSNSFERFLLKNEIKHENLI